DHAELLESETQGPRGCVPAAKLAIRGRQGGHKVGGGRVASGERHQPYSIAGDHGQKKRSKTPQFRVGNANFGGAHLPHSPECKIIHPQKNGSAKQPQFGKCLQKRIVSYETDMILELVTANTKDGVRLQQLECLGPQLNSSLAALLL